MNTAQLIVVSYAALAVEAVLLYRALEGSASALILAILVAAGVVVYFLRPHPLAKKRWVVAAVIFPFIVGTGGYYGWDRYQDRQRERTAEAEAAEYAKANVPPSFQQEYRQRNPHGSWVEMSRQWNDWLTAEVVREQQAAEAAKKETEEKARVAARLKVGDRVWVSSDSYAARNAGYYLAQRPRLYGTVVDTDFHGTMERYAIRWEEWVPNQVTWVNDRATLNVPKGK